MTGNPVSHVETKKSLTRFVPWLMCIAGLALLTYTGIRAATLTFTFDEIYSLKNSAGGFRFYPDLYERMSANNHWLNSFCLWVLQHFSTNVFFLRAPQLVSHVLFLFFSAKIILDIRRDWFAVAAFVLVNVHPYLLDFFSLARGYGLSLGCMMASLYFFLQIVQHGTTTWRLAGVLIFSILAVLSSFVMLNLFILFMLLIVVHVQRDKETSRKTKITCYSLIIVCTTGILLLVVPHLLNMQKADALFFGSAEFWNGTVCSVADRFLYNAPYAGSDHFAFAKPILYAMILLIAVSCVMEIRKKGFLQMLRSFQGSLVLVTTGVLLMFGVQAFFFKTLYPIERTAIFLFVLFLFTFLFAIDNVLRNKKFSALFAWILTVPVLFHFIYCMNFSYCLDWKQAGRTDKILDVIEQDRAVRFPGQKILLNSDAVAGDATAFVAEQLHADWLEVHYWWDAGPFTPANYYLVEEGVPRDMSGKQLLYRDEITGNQLFVDSQNTR